MSGVSVVGASIGGVAASHVLVGAFAQLRRESDGQASHLDQLSLIATAIGHLWLDEDLQL
jgi:hypothetical protein